MNDNDHVGLTYQAMKEFKDFFNNFNINYIDVISEKTDMNDTQKLIMLVIAHKTFRNIHLDPEYRFFIDGIFESDDFDSGEKLLLIMLVKFMTNDIEGNEFNANSVHITESTSMGKGKLISSIRSLLNKKLLDQEGQFYKLKIDCLAKEISKNHLKN